jgi:hypothetical protein
MKIAKFRHEIAEVWRKLYDEAHHILCLSSHIVRCDQIKKYEIGSMHNWTARNNS